MGRAGTELPIFDLRNTSPQQTPERASGSTLCANTELGTRIITHVVSQSQCFPVATEEGAVLRSMLE